MASFSSTAVHAAPPRRPSHLPRMASDAALQLVKRHPLQRLPSPSRGMSALLHSLVLCSFAYSFDYLVRNPNPFSDSYGWHMQFLTIIGLSLATATFAVGLLADLTLSHRLFVLKNALSVAGAPMECLISLLYWGLRAIDQKLVLPDWAPRISLGADLSFHAIPAIALVIDLLFFSPPYTLAFLPALALSSAIAAGYWFWVETCASANGFYPYPIFDILDTPQRAGLFAFAALIMGISTVMLRWMYLQVNGHEEGVPGPARPKERSGNVKGE